MSSVAIPVWMETLTDNKFVCLWIKTPKFPNTIPLMLSFISRTTPTVLDIMVGSDQDLPQSYAHWWCYTKFQPPPKTAMPHYPVIERCKDNIRQHHPNLITGNLTDVMVITVLMTWLDQLFIDVVLFKYEKERNNIPRLYNGQVRSDGPSNSSRHATVAYIIEQGYAIFKERGFKEGFYLWTNICQRYKF